MDLNFILPLGLQALVKIADTLWDRPCMSALLTNCTYRMYRMIDHGDEQEYESDFYVEDVVDEEMCNTVDYGNEQQYKRRYFDVGKVVDEEMCSVLIGKISKLFLPKRIEDQLVWIARHVGLQKINYYLHHEYLLNIKLMPEVYHWTSRGSIDKKKTAESLINDDRNNIDSRYTLACFYCFEEEIRELSGKISLSFKENFHNYENRLNNFWYTTIKGRKRKHNQTIEAESEDELPRYVVRYADIKTYKDAYIHSLKVHNSVAAEYFWGKLTSTEYGLKKRQQDSYHFLSEILLLLNYNHRHEYDDEEEENRDLTPKEYLIDVAFFLLNKMTNDQQVKALTADPHLTLELFLDWPLQHLFFEAAEIVCPHASEQNLSDILCSIGRKINHIYNGFDYCQFFTNFWLFLPVSQKAGVINHSTWGSSRLFYRLLTKRYWKGIFLIVGDATATQKQDFVRSLNGLHICENFLMREEWELLKLFIDSCLPSPVLNRKFKRMVVRLFLSEEKMKDVFKLLDIAENVGDEIFPPVFIGCHDAKKL